MARIKALRGKDGKRPFAFPLTMSSADPQWGALDRISLKQWMEQNGYRSPMLFWYLDYCCRDDYGATCDRVVTSRPANRVCRFVMIFNIPFAFQT